MRRYLATTVIGVAAILSANAAVAQDSRTGWLEGTVTKRGEEIIEIGKPAVVTQSAMVLVQELKRLQDEIDQLRKELAALKKSNE